MFFTYGSNELGAAKGLIVVKISTSMTFLSKCQTIFLWVFCSTSATEMTRYFSFLMSLLKSIVVFTTALSSGVILSCWQFFAIVLNSVRYDAMLSPGS